MKVVTLYLKSGAQVTFRCSEFKFKGNESTITGFDIFKSSPSLELYDWREIALITSSEESEGPYR